MFLLIDNYDSFTWNLAQAFMKLGHNPLVLKNDDPEILNLAVNDDLDMVCISPGPGHPKNAGLVLEFLDKLSPGVPVLGICLGHQILGLYGGSEIEIAPVIMHGKQTAIEHNKEGIFKNISQPMTVGRYHSLIIKETEKSKKSLEPIAKGPKGEIMGLRYRDRPWVGVQFHPESVLTPEGQELLANFPEALYPEKTKAPLSEILKTVANGKDLTKDLAAQAFSQLMDGEMTSVQAGAFLSLLHMKGESPLEISEAIKAALKRAVIVPGMDTECIDVVGTGGDGKNSFNCSTATSLTLAGIGYKVAKHGNRASSSACGAADALEGLGIKLEEDPAMVGKMLNKRNFAFLFAPYFHPSFKNIGSTRKELGIPTLFNILGPMINPARPAYLLMGVANPELIPVLSEALLRSGVRKAALACGAGGYDEITPLGPCEITMLDNGKKSVLELNPQDYNIPVCTEEELACHTRQEAIETLKLLLKGQGPAAMQNMMILNTGVAIYLLEDGMSMANAMEMARKAVKAGAGSKVLENAE